MGRRKRKDGKEAEKERRGKRRGEGKEKEER